MYIRDSVPYRRQGDLECNEVNFLWVLVGQKCMPRQFSHILIGTIYHSPDR